MLASTLIDYQRNRIPWPKSIRSSIESTTSSSAPSRSGGTFDYDQKKERLEEVDRELEVPDVWNDPDRAQALNKERASLVRIVDTLSEMRDGLTDAREILEMAGEEDDEDQLQQAHGGRERHSVSRG